MYDMNDVAMMRTSSKQVDVSLVSARIVHMIVELHQVAFVDVKKESFSRSEGIPLTNSLFGIVTINSM